MTGLFGGAFDPPHNGHVALVHAALDHFGLERLVVIPTGLAPHKHVETPAETRFGLAEAAFAEIPRVELSRWELERGEPSYTVETTRFARERWGELIFLVGADQFANLHSWHRPDEVLELARLGVATRPGYERDEVERLRDALRDPSRVEFFDIPPHSISSTEIRDRVRRGQEIDDLVPAAVAEQIREKQLYRGA